MASATSSKPFGRTTHRDPLLPSPRRRSTKRRWQWLSLLLLCIHAYAENSTSPHDLVLIANPGSRTPMSLSRETARAIFAMRQRSLDDSGAAIEVFVLPDSSPVHSRFAKQVLGIYPSQLRLAWDRGVYSGTGQAPNQVNSQAQMLDRIANTTNGVGYVEREWVDERVRAIPLR
ncbi:hypothetical protein [Halotalea alkalilenta]|uniref:hypothetical protein n=1 Tax=Halotalea alkalilenta TaxID=376489 RepID=UPI000AC0CF4A|nr:hypothetical protein [Halotalea alkalilenta]